MTLREVLQAYARRDVEVTDVVRALIAHDGYLVPADYLARMEVTDAQRVLFFDEASVRRADELWLFSDEEAARRCARVARGRGKPLGAYAAPFDGARVLGSLDERLREVRINPGGDPATSWVIRRDAIAQVKAWVTMIGEPTRQVS